MSNYLKAVNIFNRSATSASFQIFRNGNQIYETDNAAVNHSKLVYLDDLGVKEGDKVRVNANVHMGDDSDFTDLTYSKGGSVADLELAGTAFKTYLDLKCCTQDSGVVEVNNLTLTSEIIGFGRKIYLMNETGIVTKLEVYLEKDNQQHMIYQSGTILEVATNTVDLKTATYNGNPLTEGDVLSFKMNISAAPDKWVDKKLYYTRSDRVANIEAFRYNISTDAYQIKYCVKKVETT